MALPEQVKRAVVRALPLIATDIIATFASVAIAAWGSGVGQNVFGDPYSFGYMFFFAAINVAVFAAAKMYSCLWEYASVEEMLRLILSSVISCALGDLLGYLFLGARFPFRVYGIAWVLFLAIAALVRFTVRVWSGRKSWNFFGTASDGLPRSLIIGAGESGSSTVKRMLAMDPDMVGCPIGYVDDDPAKIGGYIRGVRVLGGCDEIPQLASAWKIEQLVVATPSASKTQRDRILKLCMQTGLKVLTLPGIKDIPRGGLDKVALREVEISDLLERDEIELDLSQMGYVTGKTVFVTGGGGSIGSELVRQLLPAKPVKIILFDIYENTTYELYHEIYRKAKDQGTEIVVVIGSITDSAAIREVFDRYEPQVVFHAAAHKHVPLMENCAREAVSNNVFGTRAVARLAHEHNCTHFVLISTDKAVNPTNVMGATKRMCEMVVHYYAAISYTTFVAVRFGNVLGSHGSVIPLFKRQIKAGGPVTLTHKDITRYFMTIPEASRLVITAGALAKGGETFILKMGDPVRIYDLAVNLIKLSGLRPGKDIEIKVTGLRPGEKLYEELQMEDEEPVATTNDDIMVSAAAPISKDEVQQKLASLEASLNKSNEEIKKALAEAVPTYSIDRPATQHDA